MSPGSLASRTLVTSIKFVTSYASSSVSSLPNASICFHVKMFKLSLCQVQLLSLSVFIVIYVCIISEKNIHWSIWSSTNPIVTAENNFTRNGSSPGVYLAHQLCSTVSFLTLIVFCILIYTRLSSRWACVPDVFLFLLLLSFTHLW